MSKRKGIMLCYPFEESRLSKWEPPYIIQPKYDGVRCRAIPQADGTYILLSSEENIIRSVPHILDSLACKQPSFEEFDGELYCHGLPFEEIVSITSRTTNLHIDYHRIKFHIFDLVEIYPQSIRIIRLTQYFSKDTPNIEVAPFWLAYTLDDIMERMKECLDLGYEGIVIRHYQAPYIRRRSTYMMKFKPTKSDIYTIVGYQEEISKDGKPKGTLGALTCMGDDGTTFNVGSGLSEDDRRDMWTTREDLIGKGCRVQYQHLTSGKGKPRFPVFIEVVEKDDIKEVPFPEPE